MEKSKKAIVQALICVGLLCVIWGCYVCFMHISHRQIKEIRENDFSWIAQVESINHDDKNIEIKGFAFELNTVAKNKAFTVVLRDIDTGELIYPQISYVNRADVNNYFLCKYDYSESGFELNIKADKLDMENKEYEVLIKPYWKEYANQVGIYLSKGKAVCVSPKEYVAPQVDDAKLTELVENSVLKACKSDMGIYVYQQDDMIYWVMDRTYPYFSDDGNMWMQFILYTTQNEKLPKEMLEKKCMWNNCSFAFLDRVEFETTKYRVVRCEMPKEHSVSRIETGQWGESELWLMKFQPWYSFEN